MGTFEKCQKKYHYQYIEKPPIQPKDWSFLEFGKCAHKCLENFHNELMTRVVPVSEYNSIMSESVKSALKEFDMNILRPEFPDLKRVLNIYLDKMKQDGLPQVIHNELDFNINVGDYIVRGYIDRIDKVSDGVYKVVDYKTNKNAKYLTPFQLQLYALVIKERFPDATSISGSYVLLKHDCKTLDYEFSDEDIKKTYDKVVSIGRSIDTRDIWEKNPSLLCNWCDYKEICQGNGDSWI